jgi:UDP-N-acetylglucosamine 2-epimerase (non-hydrolysing)
LKKIGLVFGTRPELIKLAPLIRKLSSDKSVRLKIINSGQHGEMLDRTLNVLRIQPDASAHIMSPGQDLAMLMSRGILSANEILEELLPDALVVHGDTTTAATFATAAFSRKIDVHHVEAGLRTHDIYSPFPEEFNRQLIARVAKAHYAPTKLARANLIREGVHTSSIFVTGNTVVDSVAWAVKQMESTSVFRENAISELTELGIFNLVSSGRGLAVVTLHRRENAGDNFNEVLMAIKSAAALRPNFNFVFPVHPNPIIASQAFELFETVPNVHTCRPMNFAAFSLLLMNCEFIISDSGGIQEEAVTLGKRVVLARNSTERPEGLSTGLVTMPELKQEDFKRIILSHIDDVQAHRGLNLDSNPFGDGNASDRICQHLVSDTMSGEFDFA